MNFLKSHRLDDIRNSNKSFFSLCFLMQIQIKYQEYPKVNSKEYERTEIKKIKLILFMLNPRHRNVHYTEV